MVESNNFDDILALLDPSKFAWEKANTLATWA